jgi:signal transduction histidine kinase
MVKSIQTIGRQLSSRLILTFIGIVLGTAVVASGVAYWLIYTQLEEQAWSRVADGQRMTLILLDAEKSRLNSLVDLTAQRPTLQRLLREGDVEAITQYVQSYQFGAEVDILAVYDVDTQLLTTRSASDDCAPPYMGETADYCAFDAAEIEPTLTVGRPILDEATGDLLGYVSVGTNLDETFVQQLATKTGLGQTIFIGDRRVASSIDHLDAGVYKRAVSADDAIADSAVTNTLTVDDRHYKTIRFPLHQADDLMIFAEAALPVSDVVHVEQQILLTLVASTIVVAVAGSIAALMLRYAIKEEALQYLRSHFLANITHEFRTPLSALRASVEFLVDEMEHLSRSEIVRLLHAIHMSVTGLQTLIDNLLESINIEAGHFSIRPRPIDCKEVVAEATRIMQPLFNRRQQQLTVSYPETLPRAYGDSTRLVQVLVNLLSNASKYGPMGKPIELSITIDDNSLIHVAVADQGAGIPPLKRDHLFRRFTRLNTAESAQQGVGLGLWVVHAIVSEHGGTVGIQERPGGGSIFWFTVPVAPAPEAPES